MQTVVLEAWELVEREQLSVEDFREFAFGNAVNLFGSTNADFFSGTAVDEACRTELKAMPPP